MVCSSSEAQRDVLLPCSVIEERLAADCRVEKPGGVAHECFEPESVVGTTGVFASALNPTAVLALVVGDPAERLKTYRSVRAASGVAEEAGSAQGGVCRPPSTFRFHRACHQWCFLRERHRPPPYWSLQCFYKV